MKNIEIWQTKDSMENPKPDGKGPNARQVPSITYYPAAKQLTDGAVLIFPGGGYAMRAEHEGRGYAEFLNAHGITAFVVNYRVMPDKFPLPLCDAVRSIRFIRHYAARFHVAPDKLAVMGSSAGGHLAALLASWQNDGIYEKTDDIDLEDYHPNLQILAYPVISFTDLTIADMESVLNFIRPEDLYHAASFDPVCLAGPQTPPAFIWHTADDDNVNARNSLSYASRLVELKIPVELHIFPEGNHGLGLAQDNPSVHQWCGLLINWLQNYIK